MDFTESMVDQGGQAYLYRSAITGGVRDHRIHGQCEDFAELDGEMECIHS